MLTDTAMKSLRLSLSVLSLSKSNKPKGVFGKVVAFVFVVGKSSF
jgi:hypothetical protein